MNYNKIIIGGRLVRDPELRFTASQTPVCSFTVATSRTFKVGEEKREETAFIDCTAWGKAGETINKYMKKGSAILVDGYVRQENWEDKQTGQKRSKLGITVETFQFAGSRPEQDDSSQVPPAKYPRDKATARSAPQTAPPFDENDPNFDSDIPFTAPTVRR